MRRAFSTSVFLIHLTDVLLIKHKLLGLWLPVGGELEEHCVARGEETYMELETPAEAAIREVREETGLVHDKDWEFVRIRYQAAGTPEGFLGYEEHDAGPKGMHMNFCFAGYCRHKDINGDGSWDDHSWVNPMKAQSTPLKAPQNVFDMLWTILMLNKELPSWHR